VLGLLLALAAVLTRWPVLPVAQWPMPKWSASHSFRAPFAKAR